MARGGTHRTRGKKGNPPKGSKRDTANSARGRARRPAKTRRRRKK